MIATVEIENLRSFVQTSQNQAEGTTFLCVDDNGECLLL